MEKKQPSDCTCRCECSEPAKTPEEKLLQSVYKNTEMGSRAITALLSKIEESPFRRDLATELSAYQQFAVDASRMMRDRNVAPKEPGILETMPAELGLTFSTVTDRSPSKLSELMINGSTMGIIDMRRTLREAGEAGCDEAVMQFGNQVIRFEENSLEQMKTYL